MPEPERRRRRLRRVGPRPPVQAPPDEPEPPAAGAAMETSAVHDPEADQLEHETERGLRGLVGFGASQVTVRAALRARDAARPTEADLAAAERDLTIVRRGWTPREDLPRSR